jgi:hypothetical protein
VDSEFGAERSAELSRRFRWSPLSPNRETVYFPGVPDRDIADEPDWEEIRALAQFRKFVSGRFGVIVIQDVARDQPIAHHRECPFIREELFVEKILDGEGHNGHDYWAKNSRIAKEQLGARLCRHPGDKLAG